MRVLLRVKLCWKGMDATKLEMVRKQPFTSYPNQILDLCISHCSVSLLQFWPSHSLCLDFDKPVAPPQRGVFYIGRTLS